MIAGLPADAWALLVVAVGLGLGLELAFMTARRRDVPRGDRPGGEGAEAGDTA